MSKYRKLIFYFFVLSFCSTYSQFNNVWYFGANAGLNFNTPSPTVLTNGINASYDATSTMSDINGNLLFYSDGLIVRDKNHNVMPNGFGLIGSNTAGQCALIVPIPCSKTKYVIFHTTDFSAPGYLNYTVVDMTLNGGLGDVVAAQKNVSLGSGWTEKLCAYYNPAGNFYWVVSHKWGTNQFVAFKVDASSIATTSVTTAIGGIHNCGTYGGAHDAMGQLTISPDGTKLINALTCTDRFEIFDFDINTGALSNQISITGDGGKAWGTVFSPDSKKIYLNSIFGQNIYQYDLSVYSQAAVVASQYVVVTMPSTGYNFGYFELGPDNKIYVARPNTSWLGIFNNPNNSGAACNFTLNGISISPQGSRWGLSRIAYNIKQSSYMIPVNTTIINETCNLSNGSATVTPVSGICTYTWLPGNQNTSSVSGLAAGIYTVIINNGCITDTKTLAVVNINTVSLNVTASASVICTSTSVASVTLAATGASSYTWNPGPYNSTSIAVTPTATTIYTVAGTNSLGCIGTQTVQIAVSENPTVSISPLSPTVCSGNTLVLSASGASTYTWLPSSSVASSVVITPTSNITYSVSGFNGFCLGTNTVFVTVVANPTVLVSASDPSICAGNSATLFANGATSYSWNPGAINGVSVVISPSVTSNYTVIGQTGLCSDTKTISLLVNNGPTLTTSSTPTTICSGTGNSATLTANGGVSYTWNPGSVVSPAYVITPTASSVYTIDAVDAIGCISTTTLSFSVTPTPTISAIQSTTVVCSANSVTMSATGASSYLWLPGASTGSAIIITPTASTIYTVTGSNGNCNDTRTLSLLVNDNPTVTALANPTVICSGTSATLSANGAISYTWIPGSIAGQSVAVSPSNTSVYTVVGSNSLGCLASAVVNVSVITTPTLVPWANPSPLCFGSAATLSVSGAAGYTWDPGSVAGASISVSPITTMVYTVTGANAFCSSTNTLNVSVLPLPSVSIAVSQATICYGASAVFTASGASTYTWMPGNVTGQTATFTPSSATIYTLVGFNGSCVGKETVAITVDPTPTLVAAISSTSICFAGSSPATLSVNGALNYTWNPGSMVGASISVSPSVSTIYTVTGSNSFGCTSTKTINLVVNPNPTVSTASSSYTICNGNSLTVNSSGALSYTWNPMNTFGNSALVSPTANTTYTVTGSNSFGCLSSAVFSVIVNPTPTISSLATASILCFGATSTLSASGASTYSWYPGALIGQTVYVTPSITTVYTVTGSNSFGCNRSQTIQVVVNPLPNLTVAADPTVICLGNSVSLNVQGAQSYSWSPVNLTGSMVTISPTVSATYTVTGSNAFGCSDTKTINVVVKQLPVLTASVITSPICKGGTAVLTANGASSYTWTPGAINGPTIAIPTNSTTTYLVEGTNSLGCVGYTTIQVNVNPGPALNAMASSSNICSGSSASLSVSGALGYTWTPAGVTGSNIVVTPSVTSLYTVVGIDGSGCLGSKDITVNVTPMPTITASSSESLICEPGNVSLYANGAYSYLWLPGNQTGSVAIVNHTATATYTVIGNNGLCSDTTTVSVLLMNCRNSVFGLTKAAGIPVAVKDNIYRISFTVTAVNVSSNDLTNVTLNENLTHTFPSPVSYTVYSAPVITSHGSGLTVNPLFDGSNSISLTSPGASTLLTNKRDTIVFDLLVDTKGTSGLFKNWIIGEATSMNSIVLSDSSNNGFIWDENGNDDPTDDNSPTIIEFQVNELVIPEVITPNSDNKNDLFVIKGLNGRSVKLSIFNRWGNKVYEKAEYDNSWGGYPNAGGFIVGNGLLPQATYYYIIEFADGNKEVKTGFVVLQY